MRVALILRAPTIAAVGAIAVVGCGSAHRPRTVGPRRGADQPIKYSECIRAHGVPNFPDPGTSGSGVTFGGNGVNVTSPAFKAAQSACADLMPGGPGTGAKPSAAVRAELVKFSTCMRNHGVSGFPDPSTTRPSRVSSLLFAGGMYLGIPVQINSSSPVFRHAAKACHGPPGF